MPLTFLPASHPAECYSYEHWMRALGCTKAQAKRVVADFKDQRVMLSSCGTYQVNLKRVDTGFGVPMLHISCKRRDREPLHDWRVKQDIKNAIVGPQCEAAELYPAESRLVDTANQYHLWAFDDPRFDFPFGFRERLVLGPGEGPLVPGAVQRPFDVSDPESVAMAAADPVEVDEPALLARTVRIIERGPQEGGGVFVDVGHSADLPSFSTLAGAQAFCSALGLGFVFVPYFA